MDIVLVDWRVKKGMEPEFLSYWRSSLTIRDRSKMAGEFLSEARTSDAFPWITWTLNDDPEATRFINVGLWADAAAFHEQVGQYFNPVGGPLAFELVLRRRALLSPQAWRLGDWPLPSGDSEGVL